MGDWLYFWKHGVKRRSEITRKSYNHHKKPAKYKRKWSPEALERRRICTEVNNKKIKFIIIKDTEEEKRNIRFITKQV